MFNWLTFSLYQQRRKKALPIETKIFFFKQTKYNQIQNGMLFVSKLWYHNNYVLACHVQVCINVYL